MSPASELESASTRVLLRPAKPKRFPEDYEGADVLYFGPSGGVKTLAPEYLCLNLLLNISSLESKREHAWSKEEVSSNREAMRLAFKSFQW